jgi:hypothetical protein
MTKILFLLKERLYSHAKTSYGLINSATHVAEYLEHEGYECKIVQVFDANCIDKEVYEYRPDIVIIEALWCPASKLRELMELRRYRHIRWVIRIHSDIGYLSAETQGMKLINEYGELNKKDRLIISMNSRKFVDALSLATGYDYTYLPNIITKREPVIDFLEERKHIDIGCFGAMRLLKNQCFQAICSMIAADQLDKKLFFHITPNLGVEKDAVLENLKELFKNSHHDLVIHDWMPNDKFQRLVRKMDIGLQLSFTESFNIVSADFISNDRVILVSDAIDWLPNVMRTSTTDYDEAIRKIIYMYKHRNSEWLKGMAKIYLAVYNSASQREWIMFLRNLEHDTHHYRAE